MFHGREWPTVTIQVILPSTLEVKVVVEGPSLNKLFEAVKKATRSSSTPQPPLFSTSLFHSPTTLLWVVYRRKMGGGNASYAVLSDFDVESLCGVDVVVPMIPSEQTEYPLQPLHVAPPPLRSILTKGKCLPPPIPANNLEAVSSSFKDLGFACIEVTQEEQQTVFEAMKKMEFFFEQSEEYKKEFIHKKDGESLRYQRPYGYGKVSPFGKEYFLSRMVEGARTPPEMETAANKAWKVFERVSREVLLCLMLFSGGGKEEVEGFVREGTRYSEEPRLFWGDDRVGVESMMEAFKYYWDVEENPPNDDKKWASPPPIAEKRLVCPPHCDFSLLTVLVGYGSTALEVFNFQKGQWMEVEEPKPHDQVTPEQLRFLVVGGELITPATNNVFFSCPHRVCLGRKELRASLTFELKLNCDATLNCQKLYPKAENYFLEREEGAFEYCERLCKGRVSVCRPDK